MLRSRDDMHPIGLKQVSWFVAYVISLSVVVPDYLRVLY